MRDEKQRSDDTRDKRLERNIKKMKGKCDKI